MKVKGSKVLAILLIAVVFLIGMELNLQNEVQAAQQMVRITKSWVNIRSSASLNSSVIKVVPMNSTYPYKGQTGDFYQIDFNGRKAYVHKSVSEKFTPSNSSGNVIGKVTINVSVGNIRNAASLSSKVIGQAYRNQTFDVVGTSGSFYKIKYGKTTAYVHNSIVKYAAAGSGGSGSGSSSNNSSKNETVIGKVTIDVKTVANIRSGASLSSSVIAKGYPGQVYDVIGKSGDFYKIKLSSSKTAYVHNSVVKFSSSSGSGSSSNNSSKNETVIGKVTIDVKTVANIRSGASLNSSVIAKGYPGEVYDVIGKSGDFYKIKLSSSKTAYVHNSVVKFSSSSGSGSSSPKDPPPATEDLGKVKVNVKTVANVRSKPTLADDKTVVGTVKAGEQFNVVAFEGEFFKINTSKYGQVYIHKSVVVYIPPKGEDQLPSFTVVPGSLKGKTVILDAGHGGHSPGAVHFGHLEKDYVLSVALKTKALLEQAGANVIMTRSSDVYVGLFARSAIANRYVMGLEVAKRQKAVDDNRVQASALTKELNNLNNEMSQLIQQYDTAEQELADVNSAIEQLNQDILQAEDDLKAAQNRVDEAKAELAAAEQALEEYREGKQDGDGDEPGDGEGESGDGDESGDEDEPDEEEQELIEAVENAQKALEEAEQAVAECEGRLDDFNAQLEDLKAQKAQLDDIIKNYPQKHTNLQNAINKKNQQLTQLETEYQTLKTQLDRAKYLEQQCKAYIASGSDSRTGIYATANKKDLEEIFEIEKAYQDQVVFISIHMNATGLAQNTTRRGVQVFYFQGNSYYNGYNVSKRKTLATKLYNKLHPAMGLPANSSPINTANFSVLRENNLPAVLLELGYMDNIYDLQELIKDTTHEKAARGIYQGLVDYFK
ncbi:MAG TPA: SH3 domain-containing protein [Clostridiales bacterium]|nr:SH3 domain-containing protein [Clostridiales bacterium]